MCPTPLPSALHLTLPDRLRHVLIVGKTGMGKSTLLAALATGGVRNGAGLALLDPHGDLATTIAGVVPSYRRNDLRLIDAGMPETAPGLNPFRLSRSASPSLLVSNLLAAMRKVWPDAWGPRTEHVLRHVLLALTEVRGATLIDAQRMLVEESHRAWVVKQVKDAHVRYFWEREFTGYGKAFLPEVLAPILNKLGALVGHAGVRALLTKSRPRFDPEIAMSRSDIIVVSLAKGRIGEDGALLLGGVLLGSFQAATMGRARLAPEARREFSLLVDEVGSFPSAPLLGLLAEARKYGVGLVLATQSLTAMDEGMRAAILGNVGTLVVFRVGADDAEILAKETTLGTPGVLQKLDIGEMVVRTGARPPRLVPPLA